VKQIAGAGSAGYLTVEGEKFNVRRSYYPPTMSDTQAAFVEDPTVRGRLPLQFNSKDVNLPPPGSKPVGFSQRFGELYVYDYTWEPEWAKKKRPPDPSSKYQSFERSQLQAKLDRDFEVNETAKMLEGAQAQLQQDVNVLEAGNAVVRERNARLAEALRRVSGKDFGDDKEAWLKWYLERRGYKYIAPAERTKPTLNVQVALPYVPQAGSPLITEGGGGGAPGGPGYCLIYDHEKGQRPKLKPCFAAGTTVETPDGPRAIESLKPGDLVLTGDSPLEGTTRRGRVEVVHRSTSDRTLALTIGGETLVATQGHPLWKLGQGWVPAGALQVGDRVATRSGSMRVEAIEMRPGSEVWNLEIADGATYQVGRIGLLSHDLCTIDELMGGR
jgi:hypothetical protein